MRWINDDLLVEAATAAAARLGADPNHSVAAAAMDLEGRIHVGVNAYHFTGGPCAELVVLGVAATAGSGPLARMVAVGDGGRGVLPPCGRCRQVMLDQHPDVEVLVPTPDGVRPVAVASLLPYSFVHPDRDVARFLPFAGRYHDDVVAGRKTRTRRYGEDVPVGETTFVFEDPDRRGFRRVPGLVESVTTVRLADLPPDDQAGLREHYPDLPGDADVLDVVIRTRG